MREWKRLKPTKQMRLDVEKKPLDPPRRRLRVLAVPNVGLANLRGDSSYLGAWSLAHANPEHFFYVALPNWTRGSERPLPNLKHLFYDLPNDFSAADMAAPMELTKDFNRRTGRYVVDIAQAHRVAVCLQLPTALSDFRRKDPLPAILIEGATRQFPFQCEVDNYTRGWAYAAAHSVFHSVYDRLFALDYVRYACSGNAVERFMKNSFIHPAGMDIESLEAVREATPKREKPTLFIGYRFNKVKNTVWTFGMLDRLYRSGYDLPIVCTTPTSETKGIQYLPPECLSWVKEIHWQCPRDDYRRHAAQCHVMISAEIRTAFPAYLIEQVCLGVVPVLPRKAAWPWIVMPEDYPFTFANDKEAMQTLKWCLEHYDEAWAACQPTLEHFRKTFSEEVTERGMLRWYLEIANERIDQTNPDGPVGAVVKTALARVKKKRFSWAEFRPVLNQHLNGMQFGKVGAEVVKIPRVSMPTVWDIREVLHVLGYEDTCDSPNMVFERRS